MAKLQVFLSWLADNKPDIFSKYNMNFHDSTADRLGIATNNNHRITDAEFEMLSKIAHDWYRKAA